jgi:thiol-disulfide isomerase/thioredoxin
MIDIVGKEQLEEFIWENKDKVIVIYFGAPWCGPCKKLKEKLLCDETKSEMSNLVVGHLDVDEDENNYLVELYGASTIPVQVFVELKGTQIKEIKKIIGFDWINFRMSYDSIMESRYNNSNVLENIESK